MIKSLSLKNFQSHKETILDLHPGVNIIVGLSDTGKTAILRGAHWILTNRPSGDSLRSHWGGNTEATFTLKEGKAHRLRTNSKNEYRLGEQSFKAVGMGIPEEISKVLDMDDINVQRQMDSPFLLADPPAEVGRVLNRVASLDVIDRAFASIEGRKRQVSRDLSTTEESLSRLRGDLDDFDYLPEMERDVLDWKSLGEREKASGIKIGRLEGVVEDLRAVRAIVQGLQWTISAREGLVSLENKRAEMTLLRRREGILKGLIENHRILQEILQETDRFTGAKILLQSVETSAKEFGDLSDRSERMGKLLSSIENLQGKIRKIEQSIGKIRKEMPDVCPTCGKPWK